MKINVTIYREVKFNLLTDQDIKKIVFDCLKILSPELTNKLEIEILFVDSKKIQSLNEKFLAHQGATDVLSFPIKQEKDMENILGSIVICPEIVEQKNEDIVSVIKHGLLHLKGYDHEGDVEKWQQAAEKIGCTL